MLSGNFVGPEDLPVRSIKGIACLLSEAAVVRLLGLDRSKASATLRHLKRTRKLVPISHGDGPRSQKCYAVEDVRRYVEHLVAQHRQRQRTASRALSNAV